MSNLHFLSTVVERTAFLEIHSHMSDNALYPLLQSAYKKSHGTETVLVIILNDVCINMNHQNVTLLVLLDLSVAFGTMDYDILLNRDIFLNLRHRW